MNLPRAALFLCVCVAARACVRARVYVRVCVYTLPADPRSLVPDPLVTISFHRVVEM